MLLKFIGACGSPRSFIEPLQRFVFVGETVQVKDSLARRLLVSGRWRKQGKSSAPPADIVSKKSASSRSIVLKRKRRNASRITRAESETEKGSEPISQQPSTEVSS